MPCRDHCHGMGVGTRHTGGGASTTTSTGGASTSSGTCCSTASRAEATMVSPAVVLRPNTSTRAASGTLVTTRMTRDMRLNDRHFPSIAPSREDYKRVNLQAWDKEGGRNL